MLRRHPRFPGTDTLFPLTTCCRSGVCADAIAAREGISRAQLDALALESQHRADRALREGRFARSLVPVHNPDGSLALDHEEFPRPETTAEGLRSEEHTSELQSLMRISYAVFCLKKTTNYSSR